MVNRYMKRCAALPSIRKIQIKTTMRYHYTFVKMAITKMQKVSDGKDPEKRESLYTIGRNVNQYNHIRKQHGASSKN